MNLVWQIPLMYVIYIVFVLAFVGERANHTLKTSDHVVFGIIHSCLIIAFVTLGYHAVKTIIGFF